MSTEKIGSESWELITGHSALGRLSTCQQTFCSQCRILFEVSDLVQAAHVHKLAAALAAGAGLGCHCSNTMSVSSLANPAILCLFCGHLHTPAYKGIQLVAASGC